MRELVFTLLQSTRTYIIKHTQNPDNAEAYMYEMTNLIADLDRSVRLVDFEQYLMHRRLHQHTVKDRWFSNKQKFTALAQDHALDIVRSIRMRFGDDIS